jgi:hypothetical protein
MFEQASESLILLTEVPGHVGGRPAVNTVRRWAGRGVRGVRLRSWLVGGRRYTSLQALAEFASALNEAPRATHR